MLVCDIMWAIREWVHFHCACTTKQIMVWKFPFSAAMAIIIRKWKPPYWIWLGRHFIRWLSHNYSRRRPSNQLSYVFSVSWRCAIGLVRTYRHQLVRGLVSSTSVEVLTWNDWVNKFWRGRNGVHLPVELFEDYSDLKVKIGPHVWLSKSIEK
jgi:hypothetical protein